MLHILKSWQLRVANGNEEEKKEKKKNKPQTKASLKTRHPAKDGGAAHLQPQHWRLGAE